MSEDPMRDREEIQRAHDILAALVLQPEIGPRLDQEARRVLVINLDVLCWVLRHDHNVSFPGMLEVIEAQLELLGIQIGRHPEMQYPGKGGGNK